MPDVPKVAPAAAAARSDGGEAAASAHAGALAGMSIRELEEALVKQGVDISDCLERSDLVNRLVEHGKKYEHSPAIELD